MSAALKLQSSPQPVASVAAAEVSRLTRVSALLDLSLSEVRRDMTGAELVMLRNCIALAKRMVAMSAAALEGVNHG